MTESEKIPSKIKSVIYVLSIIFMPMGFLVGIYLITHKDKEYNKIGTQIFDILATVIVVLLILFFVTAFVF
ncbi:MAG TPA: hypothetical protein EYQ70_03110 [Marine Group III euryarchaeote]|jgi:S-ribosylhomocysteine lyase LuxS involved in autoinducer biosynthesis|uniref:Uncharacterized protein n=1 Tax=Marine Group III euryarchaeote TaxID=2173149 RepID=A0A7J4GTT0_9ARCH|nr:hypothetical protein [Marine Group III euryarchaeote]